MTGSQLGRLLDVLDRHAPVVAVAEVVPDALLSVPDDEGDPIDSGRGDGLNDVFEQRTVRHGDHRLRPPVRQRF